jgi:membrane-associated phospholipid phosphatase
VRAGRSVLGLAACLALLVSPHPVRADEPQSLAPLRWNEEWPRFRPWEYIATGVLGPLALTEYFVAGYQPEPHWQGGNFFDDAARSAFRLRSPEDLSAIRTTADVLGVGLVVLVVGVDSVVVPLVRGSKDVALQTTLMDIEAYSFSSIVAITGYDTIGRTRPLYADCQNNPNFDVTCRVSPTASFPSGHVNEAFTAAGLSCANHGFLPIYGSKLWDTLACARDVTLATAGGISRIMGDRHWATDVLAGAGIGFAFGYGMPVLLHYAVPWRAKHPQVTVVPMPGGEGIVAAGVF